MNTLQIASALAGVRAGSVGVYAADRIPRSLTLPAAIVTNIDTSNKLGSHWVAFYIDNDGAGNYFDSYGIPPTSPHHLERLKQNCRNFRWNRKKLQSFDSKVCGEYCVMFIRNMCSGCSMRAFCNIFSSNSEKNDNLVAKLYKNLLKKLKHKKCLNANSFPRENCLGRGFQSCACVNKAIFY